MTPEEQKKLGERAVRSLLGRRGNNSNMKTAQQANEDLRNNGYNNTRAR
jgi:glutathionylspermidine synthase